MQRELSTCSAALWPYLLEAIRHRSDVVQAIASFVLPRIMRMCAIHLASIPVPGTSTQHMPVHNVLVEKDGAPSWLTCTSHMVKVRIYASLHHMTASLLLCVDNACTVSKQHVIAEHACYDLYSHVV